MTTITLGIAALCNSVNPSKINRGPSQSARAKGVVARGSTKEPYSAGEDVLWPWNIKNEVQLLESPYAVFRFIPSILYMFFADS
ncbi:hypothetical protein P691DRAFT_810220 [Macrolepiota fuliginosa MF-IS2]|uniref:Uncharacterized protein n=1 Tax=Macrolepiota fuliginosa MF-IS2 TaxID=1400762 RepID=A0A9P6BYR3_9AGAR|nr:hypothetical protein P691DRAFT_810220 [Macrolepiota fuliginosa MF-IS2]